MAAIGRVWPVYDPAFDPIAPELLSSDDEEEGGGDDVMSEYDPIAQEDLSDQEDGSSDYDPFENLAYYNEDGYVSDLEPPFDPNRHFDIGRIDMPPVEAPVEEEAVAPVVEEEEEEEEAEEGADDCCICFSPLIVGKAAVICPPRVVNGRTVGLHSVCHGCVPRLYAAMRHYRNGGGLCPLCRTDLIPLDENHDYGDTLPPVERDIVEAAKARSDARFVARIRREEEQDRVLQERRERRERRAQQREPVVEEEEPQQAIFPAHRRRKRSTAEYIADIDAEQDEGVREYKHAARLFAKDRARLTTRAWRRKQVCLRQNITWHNDAEFLRLSQVVEDWCRENIRPVREDFGV